MKLHFKPMPGLTIVTLICVAILISLGTWQFKRLQWKTALLTEVEAAVTAAPLTSLADIEQSIKAGDPVDFRRISLTVNVDSKARPFLVYKPRQDGIYWRAFAKLSQGERHLYGGFGVVRDDKKETYELSYLPEGEAKIAGYVRKDHPMGRIESWVKSEASPETNRYFKFNQTDDWDNGGQIKTDIYLDISEDETDANLLPIKRPEIRNNHLDYMLTWYSFALILFIIYALLHYRSGRLTWSENQM